ncbi:hypothetical protein PBI_SCTP2_255 [Salicola phage SCTP-2]|nr:hypothetical protein PBI_SCTP2_255 [Salicola phage SCTP-2]
MFLFHKLKSSTIASYCVILFVCIVFLSLVFPTYAFPQDDDSSVAFSWESFDELTVRNICEHVSSHNDKIYNREILRKSLYKDKRETLILCITEDRQNWMVFRFLESPYNDDKTIEFKSSR